VDPLQPDIDKATRRAALYWVEDGLQEVALGALLALLGLFLALQDALPREHPLQFVFKAGFPLLLIGLGVLVRQVVLALKDRYVHPRTGYVAFHPGGRGAGVVAALLAAVIAFAFVLLVRLPGVMAWLPAIQGVVFAGAFLYLGRKVHLMRFPIEGLLVVAGGLALAFRHLPENLGSGLLFVWTGATLAAGGLLAFRTYLRQAPRGEDA
jgi:hypothetical protein